MKRILGALGAVAVGLILGAAPANATEAPVEPYLVCGAPCTNWGHVQLSIPDDEPGKYTYGSSEETQGIIKAWVTFSDGHRIDYPPFDRVEFFAPYEKFNNGNKTPATAPEAPEVGTPVQETEESPITEEIDSTPVVEAPVTAPAEVEEVVETPVTAPAEVIDYVDTPVAAPATQLAETGLSKDGVMALMIGLTAAIVGFAMLAAAKVKTRQK